MVFVFYLLSLLVLYVVIRAGVKHGVLDAQRQRDAEDDRRRLARSLLRDPGSDG